MANESKVNGWSRWGGAILTATIAVRAWDYPAIARAKRRFGTVAVAGLLARLCREVLRLCHAADRR